MSQTFEHKVVSTNIYIPPYAGGPAQPECDLKALIARMEPHGWELVQVHQSGNWLYPERCTFKRAVRQETPAECVNRLAEAHFGDLLRPQRTLVTVSACVEAKTQREAETTVLEALMIPKVSVASIVRSNG